MRKDMSDIQHLEISLEHIKELVARGELAHKLASNREFKKLVLDGYFKDEAVRLTMLTADPSMKEHHEDIIIALKGISLFRQYFQNVIRIGDMAATEVSEHEAEIYELRQEEGNM
jgi:hypothetical protein